jgi:hypothetical protein
MSPSELPAAMTTTRGTIGANQLLPGLTKLLIRFIILIRFINIVAYDMEATVEQTIGATELRQHLTDVLHAVREQQATYIVATFERSQAALINLEEYRQFRAFKQEREAFFDWLDQAAARNATHNLSLSDSEVLAIIQEARTESSALQG